MVEKHWIRAMWMFVRAQQFGTPVKSSHVTRAATNDYFDNRLVGRLFFRLIGLNKIILFY